VSGDLEQDLAKAGGANVQLAGSSTNRVDVVSASERVQSPVPTPKGEAFSPVPTKKRGTRAAVKSRNKETPVMVEARSLMSSMRPGASPMSGTVE